MNGYFGNNGQSLLPLTRNDSKISRNGETLTQKRRRKRRRSFSTNTNCAHRFQLADVVGLTTLLVYGLYLWRAQVMIDTELPERSFILDSMQQRQQQHSFDEQPYYVAPEKEVQFVNPEASLPPPDYSTNDNYNRYLVFRPISQGQGLGNHMSGLLAAHLLGLEFNRTVCVAGDWDEFHLAMEQNDNDTVERCKKLPIQGNLNNTIVLINFSDPPNECVLKERLLSSTEILYMVANTYPRWSKIPPDLFSTYYRPKAALLDILPWKKESSSPNTVVHLRRQDPENDERAGLDDATLRALGETLPRNSKTFLVTNDVRLYTYFERSYGWKHPHWSNHIHHSAYFDQVVWGVDNSTTNATNSAQDSSTLSTDSAPSLKGNQTLQTLQLWSDWYTLLQAKHIYHTHSDFSLSAVHWNNIDSKTIAGVDETGALMLSDEPWRREGEMAPLVNRTDSELQLCDKRITGLTYVEKVLAGLDYGEDDDWLSEDDPVMQQFNQDLQPAAQRVFGK